MDMEPINRQRKIRKGYEPGQSTAGKDKTSNPRHAGAKEALSNPRYSRGNSHKSGKKGANYGSAESFLGAPVDNDLIGSSSPSHKPVRGTKSPGPVSLNKGSKTVPSINKPKRLAKRRTPKSSKGTY